MKILNKSILLVLFLCFSVNSYAFEWSVEAKVTLVQPTYMPNEASFQIDTSIGACPAGTWMRWPAKGSTEASKISNANSVYSTLMTAFVSGKTVRVYGVNDRCTIEFIHMF